MKNPITNIELFEVYYENPSNINSKGNRLIIDENHPLYGIEDESESEFYNFRIGKTPKQFLFNLNEKETRLFYEYYYEKIHNKYKINYELSYSGIIVFFGFILYCYDANYEELKNKLLLYYKENLYECEYKDFFLLLLESLEEFKKGNELNKTKIDASLQLLSFDEDEKGYFSIYNEYNTYEALENDIFINYYDFFLDIIWNIEFFKNFDKCGFESTSKYKILNFKYSFLLLLKQIIISIDNNSEKKYFDKQELSTIKSEINNFLENHDAKLQLDDLNLENRFFVIEVLGYLDCLSNMKKISQESMLNLKDKISYKINKIEEEVFDDENDNDYFSDSDYKYSYNDNEFYDPDTDLDQQHPDFDF